MTTTDKNATEKSGYDPIALAASYASAADKSAKLLGEFMSRHASPTSAPSSNDELGVSKAFFDLAAKMFANPYKLAETQMHLMRDYSALWQSSMLRMMGQTPTPVAAPAAGDKRFRHEDWEENFLFDYVKQSYLITARWLHQSVAEVEGLDAGTQRKVDFFTRQFIDALAPSNFALTNPEVFRETVATGGQNLVNGMNNLLDDIERGNGKLKISMTDTKAFELGVNIATTPGKVVFQNDLIQLIQYEPTTKKVHKRPLLIMPPWINKYYILDLREKNSLVRWCAEQGLTVFVISWVNPDAKLAGKDFSDYMLEGPLAALDAIEKATGEREVNALGYCLGGTLLAATLAYMATKKDKRIVSASFMTALVDFAVSGELGVFIDEEQVASLERKMNERGYLEGSEMADTFNMLRSNDLIWSFVINNYLMGRDPFPFDLLHWNGDSTRMPARMHSYYLRNMYLENRLKKARWHQARWRSHRSDQGQHSHLLRIRDGGPHRAVESHLRGAAAAGRQVALRAFGLGAHRRHDQSAVGEEVRLLDQRQARGHARCLAQGREGARGFLVDKLDRVDEAAPRAIGCRAADRQDAREVRTESHRSGAGQLCAGACRHPMTALLYCWYHSRSGRQP